MNLIKTVSLSSILLLSACSASLQDANSVNYGDKPINNEKTVIGMLKEKLKDPDSLKVISITNPHRGYSKYGFGSTEYGWYTSISYNAKNSYGGYVGEKTITFVYLNGVYKIATPLSNGERVFLDKTSYACNKNCPNA
ncbi:hypothetical protein ACONLG_003488 [Edwardsiella ictaluri]|uniref:Lipoprotein n=1 Tax=Edwardsiella ictaluri TaxID=67780 RepID=A0A7U3Q6Z3_EDWIC|nr:hypothetical protein [Edwardsiella ictaluri]